MNSIFLILSPKKKKKKKEKTLFISHGLNIIVKIIYMKILNVLIVIRRYFLVIKKNY